MKCECELLLSMRRFPEKTAERLLCIFEDFELRVKSMYSPTCVVLSFSFFIATVEIRNVQMSNAVANESHHPAQKGDDDNIIIIIIIVILKMYWCEWGYSEYAAGPLQTARAANGSRMSNVDIESEDASSSLLPSSHLRMHLKLS